MTDHQCSVCGRAGRLGNHNRLYIVITPNKQYEAIYCWPCYLEREQEMKRKSGWHIRDKVHCGERL